MDYSFFLFRCWLWKRKSLKLVKRLNGTTLNELLFVFRFSTFGIYIIMMTNIIRTLVKVWRKMFDLRLVLGKHKSAIKCLQPTILNLFLVFFKINIVISKEAVLLFSFCRSLFCSFPLWLPLEYHFSFYCASDFR